jgi:hypothetical protein
VLCLTLLLDGIFLLCIFRNLIEPSSASSTVSFPRGSFGASTPLERYHLLLRSNVLLTTRRLRTTGTCLIVNTCKIKCRSARRPGLHPPLSGSFSSDADGCGDDLPSTSLHIIASSSGYDDPLSTRIRAETPICITARARTPTILRTASSYSFESYDRLASLPPSLPLNMGYICTISIHPRRSYPMVRVMMPKS